MSRGQLLIFFLLVFSQLFLFFCGHLAVARDCSVDGGVALPVWNVCCRSLGLFIIAIAGYTFFVCVLVYVYVYVYVFVCVALPVWNVCRSSLGLFIIMLGGHIFWAFCVGSQKYTEFFSHKDSPVLTKPDVNM